MRPFFNEENELVDLFYAITNCHGWIKCTRNEVIARLEPLQQPKRRLAQEQLCRKLTSLGAKTPSEKVNNRGWESPEIRPDCPKNRAVLYFVYEVCNIKPIEETK